MKESLIGRVGRIISGSFKRGNKLNLIACGLYVL